MSKTANVVQMLSQEGITGPAADGVCYEMVRHYSPGVVEAVNHFVLRGLSADEIGAAIRQRDRKRADENHIANCMAVARHLIRQRRKAGKEGQP